MSGSSVNTLNRFNYVAPIKISKPPIGSFIYAKRMSSGTIMRNLNDVEEQKFRGSKINMD